MMKKVEKVGLAMDDIADCGWGIDTVQILANVSASRVLQHLKQMGGIHGWELNGTVEPCWAHPGLTLGTSNLRL